MAKGTPLLNHGILLNSSQRHIDVCRVHDTASNNLRLVLVRT